MSTIEYDGPELHPGTPEYEAEYAEYQAWAGQSGPENEPVPYTLTPQAEAALNTTDGPQLPSQAGLRMAHDAPWIANEAGCTDAEFDRLRLEQHQTEAAYLARIDAELGRELEAEDPEPEAEL
jgi:hypothetical protein